MAGFKVHMVCICINDHLIEHYIAPEKQKEAKYVHTYMYMYAHIYTQPQWLKVNIRMSASST